MFNKLLQLVARVGMNAPLLVSAIALCCGLSSTAQAIPFSQISQVYFFGDSLTDSGFNDLWGEVGVPPLPSGKAPTFTTFGGYTWAQYVARDVKGFVLPVYPGPTPADTITNNSIYAVPGFVSGSKTGVDYAAGGSTTNSIGFNETWAPSLVQQIAHYLSTAGAADPNAVYFIWSGANDILTLLSNSPLPDEFQLLTTAGAAARNIANEVALLSDKGAKRIVVISLPNIGSTPLITETALELNMPTLPASMKTVSFQFNSMLNTELGHVIATVAAKNGTKILLIDSYTLLDNVILATQAGKPYVISGQSFQFVNYTSPACASASSAIYCPSTAPNNYVFADMLHPTDMAHRVLSLQVEAQLQKWK